MFLEIINGDNNLTKQPIIHEIGQTSNSLMAGPSEIRDIDGCKSSNNVKTGYIDIIVNPAIKSEIVMEEKDQKAKELKLCKFMKKRSLKFN